MTTNASQVAAPATYDEYSPGPPAEAPHQSPVAKILRLLRGRYAWAFGIGGVLGTAGAAAGYKLPPVTYRSQGVIDVAPKVGRIVYDIEEKAMIPMFDQYVVAQTTLAGSRRVVDLAMRSPEWQKLRPGLGDEQVGDFLKHVCVEHPKLSQAITISYADADPNVAMVATNQMIKAYMDIVAERDNRSGLNTIKELEKRRDIDSARLNEIRANVFEISGELGEEAIEARYQFLIAEQGKLDGLLHELELDVAKAKSEAAAAVADANRDLTDAEIGAKDRGMKDLLEEKVQAENQVKSLLNIEQLGPRDSRVVTAKRTVEDVERRIADRRAEFRAELAKSPEAEAAKLDEMAARRTKMVAMLESVTAEIKTQGQRRQALSNLAAEKEMLTERIADVRKRLEQINVESSGHGRISVVSEGDRPVAPETDRRVPLALGGGVGGLAIGFGIVLIWGLREAKLRHVVDVDGDSSRGRFLGVVPDMSVAPAEDDDEDADTPAEVGDYCIHHIRTMLQLRASHHRKVVALTSPSPGDGKTTLGLALGMSFAATGARTLLVDCDFVGHGLTSAMRSLVCERLTRAIAATAADGAPAGTGDRGAGLMATLLAARAIAFNDTQVEELLVAARGDAALGDASAAQSVRALSALARPDGSGAAGKRRGVVGVLDGRPLEDCVVDTGIPCLTLLPVGDATAEDAKCLSRVGLERLVAEFRERYDAILIDTGPVLGSIEAAFAAAASDDVIVVITRGERQPLVDDALGRLERIGAPVAGVVFNRATNADIARSSYASRSHSSSGESAA